MLMTLSSWIAVALVVFYLMFLFKQDLVKSKMCLTVGWIAVIVNVLIVGIFSTFIGITRTGDPNWAAILCGIVTPLANTVAIGALAWGTGACDALKGADGQAQPVTGEVPDEG